MRDRLAAETKAALKSQHKQRLSALRLISAALQQADIAAKTAIPDQDAEQAQQEAAEIAVIEEFLPRQMTEAEAKEAVAAAVTEVGAASPKDMGKVMALLKERHAGQMDFGKASGQVKAVLSGG